MRTSMAVFAPPHPCGPIPVALTKSSNSSSSAAYRGSGLRLPMGRTTAFCGPEHLRPAHVLGTEALRRHHQPQSVPRDQVHVNHRRRVIPGVAPLEERLLDHGVPEVAFPVSLAPPPR